MSTQSDRSTAMCGVDTNALPTAELRRFDAYWWAAIYLSVGQIYLMGNPLLREPLTPDAGQAAAVASLRNDARSYAYGAALDNPNLVVACVIGDGQAETGLLVDVLDGVPALGAPAGIVRRLMADTLAEHHDYIRHTGEDLPEVRDWTWPTA